MSLYVLDTDTFSLYRYGHPLVVQRVDSCPPDELAITVITVEEVISGWFNALRQARHPNQLEHAYRGLAESVPLLSRWAILAFTQAVSIRYEQLRLMKLNVRKMDLRIAATFLEHSATLVTRNVRDFQRVPGLAIEDWSS